MTAQVSTSLAAGKILLTYDDYICFPDDGNRYEIIEGQMEMTPAPTPRHQGISANLHFKLMEALYATGKGRVFAAPCDVILGDHNIVQPDLIYIGAQNRQIIGEKSIHGVPDLVVEILSPSTRRRDVLTKSGLYARHGIPHYWIVDPDLERIETFALQGDVYTLTGSFTAPDEMKPAAFAGMALPLGYVFRA